jgi:hypothetical protein
MKYLLLFLLATNLQAARVILGKPENPSNWTSVRYADLKDYLEDKGHTVVERVYTCQPLRKGKTEMQIPICISAVEPSLESVNVANIIHMDCIKKGYSSGVMYINPNYSANRFDCETLLNTDIIVFVR